MEPAPPPGNVALMAESDAEERGKLQQRLCFARDAGRYSTIESTREEDP